MIILSTDELQLGDIVHNYGMRIVLDREPTTFDGQNGHTVYSWIGRVENVEAVRTEGFIPMSWLYENVWVSGQGWTLDTSEARWNVQGNDLASWTVER